MYRLDREDRYSQIIEDVIKREHVRGSRLGAVYENPYPLQVACSAGQMIKRNRFRPQIGYAEGLMLIAGTFNPELLRRVAPKADHDLFTPEMAYGPRLQNHVYAALTELRTHPDSRRAVMHVANQFDRPDTIPCTLTIHAMLKERSSNPHRTFLDFHVSMRSWDLVKGLPYDIMMFGMLNQAMAEVLGYEHRSSGGRTVEAGRIYVTASNAHVYTLDTEWVKAEEDMGRFQLPIKYSWRSYVTWAAAQITDPAWTLSPGEVRHIATEE